jgi:hypothetical protein
MWGMGVVMGETAVKPQNSPFTPNAKNSAIRPSVLSFPAIAVTVTQSGPDASAKINHLLTIIFQV